MTRNIATQAAKLLAAPEAQFTQVSTLTHKAGIPSSVFVGECPGCGAYRRHLADGLRQCGGCGQVYRATVTKVIGAPAQQVIA